jgi:hypothetical protein
MALSDHDQTILRVMEAELRADGARSSAPHVSPGRASHQYLAAAIGLVMAGTLAMAAALALSDGIGTGMGVLAFLLLVASAWSATHLIAPLRARLSTHINHSATNRDQPPRL